VVSFKEPTGDKDMRGDYTIGRAMITRWLSVLSILVGLLFPGPAWPISYDLDVRIDLFGRDVVDKSFTGTEEVVSELPQLAVTDSSATAFGAAEASPFRAHAITSSADVGSNAFAMFVGVPIRFSDNQALRDLIAPGATSLDLLLNFQASVRTVGPEEPTQRRQGQSSVTVGLGANTINFGQHKIGVVLVQNGFLVGLPEDGGDLTIPFPVAISPFRQNGLEVLVHGSIFTQAFSFGQSFTAEAEVALPNRPESIALLDGTIASTRGIEYTFLPTVTPRDGNAVIPEPASLVLLSSGLLALVLARRNRTV
jgi:hypothetical protein